jgi:hypothetical protein
MGFLSGRPPRTITLVARHASQQGFTADVRLGQLRRLGGIGIFACPNCGRITVTQRPVSKLTRQCWELKLLGAAHGVDGFHQQTPGHGLT